MITWEASVVCDTCRNQAESGLSALDSQYALMTAITEAQKKGWKWIPLPIGKWVCPLCQEYENNQQSKSAGTARESHSA